MRGWIGTLRSGAALPAAERRELLEAQAALAGAQLRVWTRRLGGLVRPAAAPPPERAAALDAQCAARLARAVDRAAEHGLFRPACLVRALALHRLLARRGMPDGRIRLGVQPSSGGLAAHAWVELAGVVLGEDGRRAGAFLPIAEGALPVERSVRP